MEENFSMDEILSAVDEIQKRKKKEKIEIIKKNDFIIITAGLPFGKAGMTNMIRLYKVGS